MTAVGGDHQGARAVRQGVVHIRACREQELRGLDVAHSRGKQQRRAATPEDRRDLSASSPVTGLNILRVGARASPNISAELEQRLDDPRMLLGHGPHQRRLFVDRLFRIHLRAGGQQCRHGSDLSGTGALHEHGLAAQQRRVWIRSSRQQLLDHGRVAICAGEIEWRDARGHSPHSRARPARINRSAVVRSSRCTAQWSAVAPSGCGAFTSTRSLQQCTHRFHVAGL